jgi:hypothetical protein
VSRDPWPGAAGENVDRDTHEERRREIEQTHEEGRHRGSDHLLSVALAEQRNRIARNLACRLLVQLARNPSHNVDDGCRLYAPQIDAHVEGHEHAGRERIHLDAVDALSRAERRGHRLGVKPGAQRTRTPTHPAGPARCQDERLSNPRRAVRHQRKRIVWKRHVSTSGSSCES